MGKAIITNNPTWSFTVTVFTPRKWKCSFTWRRRREQQQHNITIKMLFCRSHISVERRRHRHTERNDWTNKLWFNFRAKFSYFLLCSVCGYFARAREWDSRTRDLYVQQQQRRSMYLSSLMCTHDERLRVRPALNLLNTLLTHWCLLQCGGHMFPLLPYEPRWWMNGWEDMEKERESESERERKG